MLSVACVNFTNELSEICHGINEFRNIGLWRDIAELNAKEVYCCAAKRGDARAGHGWLIVIKCQKQNKEYEEGEYYTEAGETKDEPEDVHTGDLNLNIGKPPKPMASSPVITSDLR